MLCHGWLVVTEPSHPGSCLLCLHMKHKEDKGKLYLSLSANVTTFYKDGHLGRIYPPGVYTHDATHFFLQHLNFLHSSPVTLVSTESKRFSVFIETKIEIITTFIVQYLVYVL